MASKRPNRIAKLRRMSGLERVDVAARLRVSERTVYRWERGETQVPDEFKLELAEMFAVSVPWLMGWETDNDGNDARSQAA